MVSPICITGSLLGVGVRYFSLFLSLCQPKCNKLGWVQRNPKLNPMLKGGLGPRSSQSNLGFKIFRPLQVWCSFFPVPATIMTYIYFHVPKINMNMKAFLFIIYFLDNEDWSHFPTNQL